MVEESRTIALLAHSKRYRYGIISPPEMPVNLFSGWRFFEQITDAEPASSFEPHAQVKFRRDIQVIALASFPFAK